MTSLLITVIVTISIGFAQSACTTPKGTNGICKALSQCEPLMTLMRETNKTSEDVDFLKNSACGFQGKEPKVCCPEDSCTTPDGKQGTCISLYTCPHILDMLKVPMSEENRKFVENSRCRGIYKYNICCGPPLKRVTNVNRDCTPTALLPHSKTGCCGVDASSNDRIIGGENAQIDEYPWMALIVYVNGKRRELLCGGALISGKYVVTAGHCVVGDILNVGNPRAVRLGEYDVTNSVKEKDCVETPGGGIDCTEGVTVIPIEKIVPHPDYNPYNPLKRNDIALLRLTELAPYTYFIRPICLPSADHTLTKPELWTSNKMTMTTAGWGAVNDTNRSNIKLYVELPIVDREACQRSYQKINSNMTLWKGQICAGGELNKDSCKGDSGGPLIYETKTDRMRTFELSGVVNFGTTPCGRRIPGVYTNVYEFNSWIRSEVKLEDSYDRAMNLCNVIELKTYLIHIMIAFQFLLKEVLFL